MTGCIRFACVAVFGLLLTCAAGVAPASAAIVTLTNPTATVEQGGFPISNVLVDDGFGWAVSSAASVAVFEVSTPIISPASDTDLTFTVHSDSIYADHVLGKFRLSVTSDVGPLSAFGVHNWVQLSPSAASALTSNPVTIHGNNIVQAADLNAAFDTITVLANSSLTSITGFRLEAIQDGTGSYAGPGIPGNANFVLDLFEIDAVVNVPGTLTETPADSSTIEVPNAEAGQTVTLTDAITLENTGIALSEINVQSFSITGPDAAQFDLSDFAPALLNGGESIAFDVEFTSLFSEQEYNAVLTIVTDVGNVSYDLHVTAVPEPAALAMLLLGSLGLVWQTRRRACQAVI